MVTRDFATDPEIAEDLIRRARSERDASRTGEFTFGDPAIVEHWPCRKRCGAKVGVTAAALFALETNNRKLVRDGKPPIGKHEVMWCPECKARDEDLSRMQLEAKQAARRPREQLGIPLGEPEPEERPSGMVQRENRRRKP